MVHHWFVVSRGVRLAVALAAISCYAPLVKAGAGSGILYGFHGDGGPLRIINPATGAETNVGGNFSGGLAVHPTTGIMYAGQGTSLSTVNPATGAETLVGSGANRILGMDFRSDGVLFASLGTGGGGGTGGTQLGTINTATGAQTVIGAFGVTGMEGLAFSPTGVLFGSKRLGTGTTGIYTINTATGAATLVAPTLDGLGSVVLVVSLQFACNGTLYGGSHSGGVGLSDLDGPVRQVLGGTLVTVNPVTGLVTPVGGPGGSSLAGLAFGSGCGVCPHHTVHGHIDTVPPTHSGTFSGQHHGTHGHTVTAGATCPPHAPFHSPGLTADPGEGLFSVSGTAEAPDFVAAVGAGGTTEPVRRGGVVQLFGSAPGFFLGEMDDQPVMEITPPASGSPLFYTTSLPEVKVGGVAAKVLFSGLAPGLKGVWQINVLLAEDSPLGRLPVSISYEGNRLTSVDIRVE